MTAVNKNTLKIKNLGVRRPREFPNMAELSRKEYWEVCVRCVLLPTQVRANNTNDLTRVDKGGVDCLLFTPKFPNFRIECKWRD